MNTHGWTALSGPGTMEILGGTLAIHSIAIAPIIEERNRCACLKVHCRRSATAEDLLCDECRTECR